MLPVKLLCLPSLHSCYVFNILETAPRKSSTLRGSSEMNPCFSVCFSHPTAELFNLKTSRGYQNHFTCLWSTTEVCLGLYHFKRLLPKKGVAEVKIRTNLSALMAFQAPESLKCDKTEIQQEEGKLLCSLKQIPISLFSLLP